MGHHVFLRGDQTAVRRRAVPGLVFAGPTAGTLVRHNLAAVEDVPTHTPANSAWSIATAKQASRIGHCAHKALARSRSAGASANQRFGSFR